MKLIGPQTNSKRPSPNTHYNNKIVKNIRERILAAAKEDCHIQGNLHKFISVFLSRSLTAQERVG